MVCQTSLPLSWRYLVDGNELICGSKDGIIRTLDFEVGEQVRSLDEGLMLLFATC